MVKDGYITSITGEDVPVDADSICMHGDTPGSVNIAKEVKGALETAGVNIVPLSKLV
jgi:UPF0271 protein